LLLFEVARKRSRALADVDLPAWPGVSPDGKQIAVAWTTETADREPRMTVQACGRWAWG
jgi:hypothetical protein